MSRLPHLAAELLARAVARFDRRGGAGVRRGGRGRGRAFRPLGPPPLDPNTLVNDQGEVLTNDQGEVLTSG